MMYIYIYDICIYTYIYIKTYMYTLPTHLSTYLSSSVYLSICLSVYISIHLSIHIYVYQSTHPFIQPSTSLPVYLFIHPSIYLRLPIEILALLRKVRPRYISSDSIWLADYFQVDMLWCLVQIRQL